MARGCRALSLSDHDKFLELAASERADLVVSGDQNLLNRNRKRGDSAGQVVDPGSSPGMTNGAWISSPGGGVPVGELVPAALNVDRSGRVGPLVLSPVSCAAARTRKRCTTLLLLLRGIASFEQHAGGTIELPGRRHREVECSGVPGDDVEQRAHRDRILQSLGG